MHLDDERAVACAEVRRVVQRGQRERLVRRRAAVDDRRAQDAGELRAAVRLRGARQDGRGGERSQGEGDELGGGEHRCRGVLRIMFRLRVLSRCYTPLLGAIGRGRAADTRLSIRYPLTPRLWDLRPVECQARHHDHCRGRMQGA